MNVEDFIYAFLVGVTFTLVVVGMLHEWRKTWKAEKELKDFRNNRDNKITNVVVDAIAFELDVWNCGVSICLLIDTQWKRVADIDFNKLQQQNIPQGTRFIRSTTPINAVKNLTAPLVFGGYR